MLRTDAQPRRSRSGRIAPAGPDRRLTGRQRLLLAAVAVAVAAGWLFWPKPAAPPPPRARQYLDFTACLLTDEHGLAGPQAAAVWSGMQQASRDTRAKVEYLTVSGAQTVENAAPFVASLAQNRCDLVLAAAELPVAAVRRAAPSFPAIRFVVLGSGPGAANIAVLDVADPARVAAVVAETVTSAVSGHPR